MKKSILYFASFLSLLFAMGCSKGLDEKGKENPETIRKRERLKALGETLQGIYLGYVNHVDGNQYQIEIRLFTTIEVIGRDENGEINTLPKLQGQIRYMDFVYPMDEALHDVRFNESGKLEMILSKSNTPSETGKPETPTTRKTPGEPTQVLSFISGTWNDGEITASWNTVGKEGDIHVQRTQKSVSAIEETERRERLRNQFEDVIGYYRGNLYRYQNLEKVFGILESTVHYEEATGTLSVRLNIVDNIVIPPPYTATILWDPRSKVFDIDDMVGIAHIRASGFLDENGLHYTSFKIAAEPFTYHE